MRFIFVVWALSRAAIVAALAIAAPHAGIAALGNWDGAWYGSVVERGYEYGADGAQHNVAFFPLLPLLSSSLVHVGVPWPIAGVVLNNAAFLIFLFVLFAYSRERLGGHGAKWAVLVACVLPLSLFCSAAYSEGLFMLTSCLALLAYQRGQYLNAGIAATAASATRPFGAALAVALVIAAILERRSLHDIVLSSFGFLGIGGFAMFCAWRFHDPIAFMQPRAGDTLRDSIFLAG